MKSLNASLSSSDKLLLVLGFIGFLLFGLLLPHVHPDAAVRFDITQEEAIELAQEYARQQGYNPANLTWSATPIRTLTLLDSLLSRTSPPTLRQYLVDSTFEKLPAYQWSVSGQQENNTDGSASGIEIKLNTQGSVWHFAAPLTNQSTPLTAALRQAPSLRDVDSLDAKLNDSSNRLIWALEPRGNFPAPLDSNAITRLSAEDARAIARYLLTETLFSHFEVEIDSVYRPRSLPPRIVRMDLKARDPVSGIAFSSLLDLSISGRLAGLITTFTSGDESSQASNRSPRNEAPSGRPPDRSNDQNGTPFTIDIDQFPDYLMIGAYILVGIFILVLFLRRLNARLIDVKSAMQDAIWGGLFAAVYTGNAAGMSIYQENDTFWLGLLFAVGLMILSGSFGAFVVFILSCATDSIARVIWPRKLSSLSLARNVRFLNTSMGISCLRAVGLAGLCLGISTLFLYLPGVVFVFDENMDQLIGHSTISPLASIIALNGWKAMLITMSVLLGIGTTLYSKRPSKSLLIGSIVLLCAFLQIGPLSIKPILGQWVLSGLIGFVLATVFLRFDFMSTFTGFLCFGAIWEISPEWFIPVSEAHLDAVLTYALIPGLLVLGLVGLRSKKVQDEASLFVPEYLRVMAQQERLQGELEIAKQVQASLLPLRMPEIKGLDIAAMCLPAEEVGGDYFDFIHLDDHRLAIVVGDVSGKGIQAAFYMTLTKGFIHATCNQVDSPAEVLTRVNRLFCKNVPRGTFISLIYGVLDTKAKTFTFARAGHDPLLYRTAASDRPTFLKPPGLAIGLTPSKIFDKTIKDTTLELAPNDILVFYTDGVTEATNPAREQFGPERLSQKVGRSSVSQARQILDEVSNQIHMFMASAGRSDDMTLIVLRYSTDHEQSTGSIISSATLPSWLQHQSQTTN